MNLDTQLITVLLLSVFTSVCTEKLFQDFVDHYQTWYDRRNLEAAKHEFPKDARMYEAGDKIPKCKIGFGDQ